MHLLKFQPWLLFLALGIVILVASFPSKHEQTTTLPLGLQLSDRIVVIAPHPDDEVLGVGGLLIQARQAKIPVSVILMTNGDRNYYDIGLPPGQTKATAADHIAYGKTRQQEAILASQRMGISRSDLYFMSLPNRGLLPMLSSNWQKPYTSPHTGFNQASYPISYLPNLSYTGQAAQAALTQLIQQLQPTVIFAPMLEDQHPDHAASSQYLKQLLPGLSFQPQVYTYLVHSADFPQPSGFNPGYSLDPPASLSQKKWMRIALSTQVQEQKRQALNAHVTQLAIPEAAAVLEGLMRTNELVVKGL